MQHDYQKIADDLTAAQSETNIAAAIAALKDAGGERRAGYIAGVEGVCSQLATELGGDFTQNEKNKIMAAIPALRAAAGL